MPTGVRLRVEIPVPGPIVAVGRETVAQGLFRAIHAASVCAEPGGAVAVQVEACGTTARMRVTIEGEGVAGDAGSVSRITDGLDPALKETALLVIAEDMSHAQAGEILGVKEATVSWRMHEIRKRLKMMARTSDA